MTKENQQQKNLNDFRLEIDKIDQKILQLLQERVQVVKKVAKFKEENKEKFFIKSAREADMIKNLIKLDTGFSKSAILKIWRTIITSANLLEQPIRAVICNPENIADYKYLVKSYYLDILPIIELESANNVILEIEKNPEQVAVFPVPTENKVEENWWLNLANNKFGLKIFAKIPFIHDEELNHELFLSAVKKPEKSSADNSLMVVEINKSFGKNDLIRSINNCKISAKILKSFSAKQYGEIEFYLVETDGFYDLHDEKLINLCKEKISPFIRIIGYYPKQICNSAT